MLRVVQDEAARTELSAALDEIVRDGALRMLTAALEAEVDAYVTAAKRDRNDNGRALVTRNGRARERTVVTGAGALGVRAPRVDDKRANEKTGERVAVPARRGRRAVVGRCESLPALRSPGRLSSGTPDLARLRAVLTRPTWENAWGKLPTRRPGARVVLLGQQADVVAETEEPLEQRPGIVVAAEEGEVVGKPERAGQDSARRPWTYPSVPV